MRGVGGGLSAYAVNGSDPATVADFAGVLNSGTEYYRTGGSATTFADMFTHARSSNATMVDSDGLLKWGPHNLLTHSNPISAGWGLFNATLTANSGVASDGTTTLSLMSGTGGTTDQIRLFQNSSAVLGVNYTVQFEFRPIDCDFVILFHSNGASGLAFEFDTSTGTATSSAIGANSGDWTEVSKSMMEVETGLWLCSATFSQTNDTTPAIFFYLSDSTSRSPAAGPYDGYIGNIRYYRSDLGGMADNPDRGDSYVPTTSAARYLPRRNHYRYNGSSYVKKGILLESAAATNLQTYSGNFSTQWDAENATVTNNQRTGPDGATSMAAVAETTANNIHGISDKTVWSATSGVSYTTSAYVAPRGATQYVQITYGSPRFGLSQYATFDLINGTVSGASIGTGHIELVASGIYRIGFTAAATNTGTAEAFIISSNAATGRAPSFVGNTANGFFVYGVDTKAASAPSSLVATSGSTATRAAETLTAAGSNLDASTTAMSFHLAGEENYADLATAGQVELFDWRVDANNRITVTIDTDGAKTGTITLTMVNGGSSASVAATTQLTPGLNKAFNVAWRVTGSEINIALDGTAATATATAIGVPDLSSAAAAFEGRGTRSIFRQAAADWTDSGIESAST